VSHKIVDGASDYSLTKDMMKKLYSISKKQAPKVAGERTQSISFMGQSMSKNILLESLKERENF